MARNRSFEISGINLRVHTKHDHTEYSELWKSLYENRGTALYGSTAMMIGEARAESAGDSKSPITGYFYKFLNIDPDEPWFDIQRKKPALDEDVSKVSIPNYLKPNLSLVPYVFLPTKHRIYFVSKASSDSMAASTVYRLISKLVLRDRIIKRFGEIDITVLTDRKAIDDLLSWQVIRTLEIFLERPNALEHEDEADVLERLNALSAGSERRILKKAPEAPTLTLDEKTKMLAHVAANNGEVNVTGRNSQGLKDHASSKKFPMHETVTYSPNDQTAMQALVSFVMKKFM